MVEVPWGHVACAAARRVPGTAAALPNWCGGFTQHRTHICHAAPSTCCWCSPARWGAQRVWPERAWSSRHQCICHFLWSDGEWLDRKPEGVRVHLCLVHSLSTAVARAGLPSELEAGNSVLVFPCRSALGSGARAGSLSQGLS